MTSETVRTDPPDPQEAARYVASMAEELAQLARSHNLELLAHILDMARLEADQISRRWGDAGSGDRAPDVSGYLLPARIRRRGANAVEEGPAWITVRDHAEPLLKLAHRVA